MLRIYVASLSDYNAGILHGVWIDCEGKSADDIMDEVRAMLKASPAARKYGEIAEEWAIHDHEGFGSLIGEYTGFDTVAELVEAYEELGDDDLWPLYLEWLDHYGDSEFNAVEAFWEAYSGTYRTVGDWAAELNEGCFDIPKALENYIDWDAMGRDAEFNGDIFTINRGGSVAVFWNH